MTSFPCSSSFAFPFHSTDDWLMTDWLAGWLVFPLCVSSVRPIISQFTVFVFIIIIYTQRLFAETVNTMDIRDSFPQFYSCSVSVHSIQNIIYCCCWKLEIRQVLFVLLWICFRFKIEVFLEWLVICNRVLICFFGFSFLVLFRFQVLVVQGWSSWFFFFWLDMEWNVSGLENILCANSVWLILSSWNVSGFPCHGSKMPSFFWANSGECFTNSFFQNSWIKTLCWSV